MYHLMIDDDETKTVETLPKKNQPVLLDLLSILPYNASSWHSVYMSAAKATETHQTLVCFEWNLLWASLQTPAYAHWWQEIDENLAGNLTWSWTVPRFTLEIFEKSKMELFAGLRLGRRCQQFVVVRRIRRRIDRIFGCVSLYYFHCAPFHLCCIDWIAMSRCSFESFSFFVWTATVRSCRKSKHEMSTRRN